MQPGNRNVLRVPLIDRDKVLLPPLHIKLGLMKNFVKAIENNSDAFWYLCNKFPELSYEKVKEGVFIGQQIKKVIADTYYQDLLNDTERNAWVAFKSVVVNFLGNYKSADHFNVVKNCISLYK